MQPGQELEEVKLEPNQNESMSPQRKFLTSKFGKSLIDELKRTKLDQSDIAERRRDGISGIPGQILDIDTVSMLRTQKLIQKLVLTKAFVTASPLDQPAAQPDEEVRSSAENLQSNISAT